MTEPLKTMEISIARVIHPNGRLGFTMSTPEEFSFIETLGLLAAAQWQLYDQMSKMYGG